MNAWSLLLRGNRGASAAEFALVLPLLLILLFGIIDVGRFMWEYNRAEKATQMGVRYAVVTDLVPSGLGTHDFVVDSGIPAGDTVPVSAFDTASCTSTACACTGPGTVCSGIGYDSVAFEEIVDRMQAFHPMISDTGVTIEYRNIGLGYAGDPNGPDVAPLVTVELTGLQFTPITLMLFGVTMSMPDFHSALTLEDGSGNVSN